MKSSFRTALNRCLLLLGLTVIGLPSQASFAADTRAEISRADEARMIMNDAMDEPVVDVRNLSVAAVGGVRWSSVYAIRATSWPVPLCNACKRH